ncbi:MAG TPA: hypothetical protein VKX31_01895 [Brumimicrobium sp.]|nr:hypothetical protein [Brumimicrobium sp.]
MKKMILSAAIILGGLTAMNAQTDKETTAMNVQNKTAVEAQIESNLDIDQDAVMSEENVEAVQESAVDAVQDYKEVKTSEVPQNIKEVVAKTQKGATISKAYVNAEGEYKLQLATADGKNVTVLTDANGQLIQNEIKKQ